MSTPARRPNLVFIMSDDHAAHAISAYGSRVNTTPHLDRIAAQGARLDATFCTNSVCAPSRATILTGTHSHINGVRSIFEDFDYRVSTFPEVLQRHGWATALFGKWHLGHTPESNPRGFDDWQVFPDQGDYFDPEMISPRGSEVVPGYATDITTDLSLDWLASLDDDQPFCLLVHHKAPTGRGCRTRPTTTSTRWARSPNPRPCSTTTPPSPRPSTRPTCGSVTT